MTTLDWLRINNKCDVRLADRFAEREFFKFFKQKITRSEPMILPQFPSFSLPNPWNFAKFLRTPFLQNTSARLLLNQKYILSTHWCQFNRPILIKGTVMQIK